MERDSSELLELELDHPCIHSLEVYLLLNRCMKVGARSAGFR